MSTVLAETAGTKWDIQDHQLIPQIDNKSTYYDEKTGKTYFKVFLLNNKVNKRKFKLINPKNIHQDVDGYENLPLTFVKEGIRKGNHPNPKDANIFEANYQNKYSYVTKAIDYYKTFGVAKIVKIFKPDLNLLTASHDPILNYYALCETNNPVMLELLAEAKKEDKDIYVSPAMFSWDWTKDPETGIVNVNSFVPTHLAIVDSPAYDPDVAYIKKQTCQKDGMSCYYELFEASEVENLNNNNPPTNNMSSTPYPKTLEEYAKSGWIAEVTDAKDIPAEELVKNKDNIMIIDKTKMKKQEEQSKDPEPKPVGVAKPDSAKATSEPYKGEEEAKPVPASKKEKHSEQPSFTLDDVKALLEEQKQNILKEIKAEQTKGQREQLLDTYLQNEKVKSLKDKIDSEKLNKTKELYNSLPLDNDQLKVLLDNSIYNPQFANPDIYAVTLALAKEGGAGTEAENNTKDQEQQPKPKGAPKNPTIPPMSTTNNQKIITSIPEKPAANLNMYGTEFKASSESGNKYNDDYKSKNGKSFEASASNNEYRPEPTTGKGIPKGFQKYIH